MRHKLKRPTESQIEYAKSLGINTRGKAFRIITAEIADALEVKSFEYIEQNRISKGVKVEYIGSRTDMPRYLEVSTVAPNGFLYFKKIHKYCRPWNVRVINKT